MIRKTASSQFLLMGSIFAGLAVAAGAFGAHFLKGILDAPMLATFETAARYQMYHALGLCIVSWAIERHPDARFAVVGWLFTVYLIHTLAELCLSPVGLSAMTKLAPAKIVSQMMGVWFLGASIGNFLGGQAASFYETMALPTLLMAVAILPILAGIGMLLVRKPFTRLGGDAL